MKTVYTVAHTHWDFEWYFTRQEAKVQFIFHMDEVLASLETNQLDFYVLDGQMAILDDYLILFPEKTAQIENLVKAGRLLIGPWFTQIDEMTTTGESIVRNLRAGIKMAEKLGGAMRIGYLPDSFGQSQDMPKIYQGFQIEHALFWRGMPKEAKTRYFYWSSNDGSKVLTANIKNGYYAGVDLIEQTDFDGLVKRITTDSSTDAQLLPVGGDQRAVDFNLKERIALANQTSGEQIQFIESNYPQFFKALEQESDQFPELSGEFIEPTDSKIHRGIYSSRYDLKQLYDLLERLLTYQLEPLAVVANTYGIEPKQGLLDSLWQTIARGQAHDSAGGCNSDKTNQDILNRGINALQEAESYRAYVLRKLSLSIKEPKENELFIWNPLPFKEKALRQVEVTTKSATFELLDQDKQAVEFEILAQHQENAALLRRDPAEMVEDYYFVTTILVECELPAMDVLVYQINEQTEKLSQLKPAAEIENERYIVKFNAGKFDLYAKQQKHWYNDFLQVEDGGDEGDTYDYSPAFADWILALDFSQSTEQVIEQGKLFGQIKVRGTWQLPKDLAERQEQIKTGSVAYDLQICLQKAGAGITVKLVLDNAVLDHRMRLLLKTDLTVTNSFADTPFGVIKRPVEDPHLTDWYKVGYKEEPTSLRAMLHFANIHDDTSSWSFLTLGSKDFQIIGERFDTLAVTIFRGVGFLGRPDIKRRPGDASGLQTKVVATPASQLLGTQVFEGQIVLDSTFEAQRLQQDYLALTQTQLYYQNQLINRFTTPIQYFPVNQIQSIKPNDQIVTVEDLKVTFSSMLPTIDQTGLELRFYNPTDEEQLLPGTLHFSQPVGIALLDLEGKVQQTISSDTTNFTLAAFKPGEIRTYGIYFKQKGPVNHD